MNKNVCEYASDKFWHVLNKVPKSGIGVGIGVLIYLLYLKGTHDGITELVDMGVQFCDENGHMLKARKI